MTSKTVQAAKARRPKSGASEAVLNIARGLHRTGAISKKTMREYESLCLEPAKPISPEDVVRIRQKEKVSQNLFARYLNTSESTVQKWETGAKRPSGPAVKLLRVVERHGLKVLT